jgi:hypothetical protein
MLLLWEIKPRRLPRHISRVELDLHVAALHSARSLEKSCALQFGEQLSDRH